METTHHNLTTPATYFRQETAPYRFSLSSLMLLITLASILMGVLTLIPLLGVLLSVLSAVAVPRTGSTLCHRATQGLETGIGKKITLFTYHFCGAWVVLMNTVVTFVMSFILALLAVRLLPDVIVSDILGFATLWVCFFFALFLAAYAGVKSWKSTKTQSQMIPFSETTEITHYL